MLTVFEHVWYPTLNEIQSTHKQLGLHVFFVICFIRYSKQKYIASGGVSNWLRIICQTTL